jgi:predicted CoA-binding protein
MRVLLPEGAEVSADPILEILKNYKTIAVVGLSSNRAKPSHGVAEYMQSAGYRIIPVNPNEKEVLGEKSYARLEDVPEKIEIVDIFRRAKEVLPAVESAIRVGARVAWMQLGIENAEAAEKARAAGLVVIEALNLYRAGKSRAEARRLQGKRRLKKARVAMLRGPNCFLHRARKEPG